MSRDVFICDTQRTPIGRYGGALARVRTDDLAAIPIRALLARHPDLAAAVDEVLLGCANQAGEDNRNVARMALLLAGLPASVPGMTVNRLCASGLDAVGAAARAIRSGEIDVAIAGGVESMTRAPLVMGKAETAFQRERRHLRHHHRLALHQSADEGAIRRRLHAGNRRERRDGIRGEPRRPGRLRPALAATRQAGRCSRASSPTGSSRSRFRAARAVRHWSSTTNIRAPTRPSTASRELKPIVRPDGTVTAGNASGVNDGAAALILASAEAAERLGLTPMARILGMASAGVPPRIMGIGPVPATKKLLERLGLGIADIGLIEINEAFASQALACLRQLGTCRRRRARQSERRGDRVRPSARHVGRADCRRGCQGTAAARRPLRPCDDVRRRRPGRRHGVRTRRLSEEESTMASTYPLDSLAADPPSLSPDYVGTRLRAPKQPLVILPHTMSELTGPIYGHESVRPTDSDLTVQHAGATARRADHRQRPRQRRGRPPGSGRADRNLAGERGGPLRPYRRPAPGAARSEFFRSRAGRDRRRRPLPLHDHQAWRLPVEEPPERLAAGAHPPVAVRTFLPDPPDHPDVFSGRPAFPLRPDLQCGHRRKGAEPADLGVRPRNDQAGMGPRLPLRHRPPRPERHPVRGAAP